MKRITGYLFLLMLMPFLAYSQSSKDAVEKWGMYELVLNGPGSGNPFVGIDLSATFTNGDRIIEPEGFYDGSGLFKIRFMPDKEGVWTYKTKSNRKELNGIEGQFTCVPASMSNHGPVQVRNQYHFEYKDGTSYYPFGTTIYEWVFQSEDVRAQTLETLKSATFNKVRFLLVPPYKTRYLSGSGKLENFPFEGTSINNFDFSRFNVEYFQHFEKCLQQILDLGIEADVILFRPYDGKNWGFDKMDAATNDRFTRYVVARLAAYRNVWWSMANENSFMDYLTEEDWDRLFQLVDEKDPYNHLLSIHNADDLYDYTKPWVTHVSFQYYNAVRAFGASAMVRDIYHKPVVNDEINYEGNISSRWGQLSGEEMTFRFWLAYTGGTYATHGEAIVDSSEIEWISEGGVLRGESPSRIAFLKKVVESGPEDGLEPIDHAFLRNVAGQPGEYYLYYFGKEKVKNWDFLLPRKGLKDGMKFKVELIDTWNMSITPISTIFEIKKLDRYNFADIKGRSVKFPGKSYMAMRITRIQ
jgi:hypothetical protein